MDVTGSRSMARFSTSWNCASNWKGLAKIFHSETDTEVIVAAYHHWGAACVLKFNGMWAFAIWDSQRRELFLSRDRFGIKPLHYLSEPRRFVFASELKSFLHLQDFAARENEEELRRALTTRGESEEATLVQGVKLLRPGHNLLVSTSRTRIWCWWRTLDHLTDIPKPFSDQAERFRELFFDACSLRLRFDVPVATCLSGGMDSSSILCSVSAPQQITRVEANGGRMTFIALTLPPLKEPGRMNANMPKLPSKKLALMPATSR